MIASKSGKFLNYVKKFLVMSFFSSLVAYSISSRCQGMDNSGSSMSGTSEGSESEKFNGATIEDYENGEKIVIYNLDQENQIATAEILKNGVTVEGIKSDKNDEEKDYKVTSIKCGKNIKKFILDLSREVPEKIEIDCEDKVEVNIIIPEDDKSKFENLKPGDDDIIFTNGKVVNEIDGDGFIVPVNYTVSVDSSSSRQDNDESSSDESSSDVSSSDESSSDESSSGESSSDESSSDVSSSDESSSDVSSNDESSSGESSSDVSDVSESDLSYSSSGENFDYSYNKSVPSYKDSSNYSNNSTSYSTKSASIKTGDLDLNTELFLIGSSAIGTLLTRKKKK